MEQVQNLNAYTLVALLIMVCATAISVKWIKMPYAVALVIAGMIAGFSHSVPAVHMTPELVLLIFLPPLLFEAAWNLELKSLRRDWIPISALATIGVVVCMFSVAAVLHLLGGLPTSVAFLFGAIVSATDPVSVVSIFRQLGVNKRLTMLLEGESLFNDGTAVVLFKLVLALMLTGGAVTFQSTVGTFALVVAGGALVGVLMGFIASQVTSAFDDHLLEITLTTITAYGSFLVAEQLHVSSVIAVVAAGIVLGNYGSQRGMSATTRVAVNSFWEYAAFLGNSLLFLLIGLEIDINVLMSQWQLIGMGIVAVVVARILVVYGLCPFLSTERSPIPDSWRHMLFWGGLRGALCMALALSLPNAIQDRQIIINMTFGLVLFTLLVPGLTAEPMVKLLKLAPKPHFGLQRYHELSAELMIIQAQIKASDELLHSGAISQKTHQMIVAELEQARFRTDTEIDNLQIADTSLERLEIDKAKLQLLEVRRDILKQLHQQGLLDEEAISKQRLKVDEEFEALRHAPQDTVMIRQGSNSELIVVEPVEEQPTGEQPS